MTTVDEVDNKEFPALSKSKVFSSTLQGATFFYAFLLQLNCKNWGNFFVDFC